MTSVICNENASNFEINVVIFNCLRIHHATQNLLIKLTLFEWHLKKIYFFEMVKNTK